MVVQLCTGDVARTSGEDILVWDHVFTNNFWYREEVLQYHPLEELPSFVKKAFKKAKADVGVSEQSENFYRRKR